MTNNKDTPYNNTIIENSKPMIENSRFGTVPYREPQAVKTRQETTGLNGLMRAGRKTVSVE